MRKKRKLRKGNNTKVAIIFIAFVAFIVSASLVFKFIYILSQSKFDDSKKFTLAVSNKKAQEVILFSPGSAKVTAISSSLTILKLENDIAIPASQFLAIPVDGFVRSEILDLNQKIETLLAKMILNYKKMQTNLTMVDLIKLFVFAKRLPERETNVKNIPKDISIGEIDSMVTRLVNDEQIEKDSKTIQIINGTNVAGLGNRLARLVTNIGGDVIIVATANRPQKYSEITYIDDKSYTAERLGEILGFRTIKVSDRKIADITIIIGEDSINPTIF